MSLWLDADELAMLTGYKQREMQRKALADLRIEFRSRPADGYPLVTRAQFLSAPGREPARAKEPRFS